MLENVTSDHAGPCRGNSTDDLRVLSTATGVKITIAGSMTTLLSRLYIQATNVSLILRDGVINSIYMVGTGSDIHVEGATLGDPLDSSTSHNVLYAAASAVAFDHAAINGEIVLDPQSTLEAKDSAFRFSTTSVGVTSRHSSYVVGQFGSGVGNLKMSLARCTFDGGLAQLQVAAADDVLVRGCQFSNYERYGIYVIAPPTNLDLGTATDSGGNVFTGSSASGIYGLYDGRTTVGSAITASGTSFNGTTPAAGVVTKSATVAGSVSGAYYISTPGNSITFY